MNVLRATHEAFVSVTSQCIDVDWSLLYDFCIVFLTFQLLEVSLVGRRELDTTHVSAATTLVQDVRFYRDLNSDRWIQSPEC